MAKKSCAACGAEYEGEKRDDYCSLPCALWNRVKIRGHDECWLWIGSTMGDGYGQFNFRKARYISHRVAHSLADGDISEETPYILHSCDNPQCCNPRHLTAGTHTENMEDKMAKGRQARGVSHARAKMSETDVHEIRWQHSHGLSMRALARAYGVCHSTIRTICRGLTWRHITASKEI